MPPTTRTFAIAAAALFGTACADPASQLTAPDELSANRAAADERRGGPSSGTLVYGLTAEGEIITFRTSQPNRVLSTARVTGLRGGDRLVGLDFRPSDLNDDGINDVGQLYAVAKGASGGSLYLLDPATGRATFGSALVTMTGEPVALSGTAFGVGFNPTVDRLRVHSDAEINLRINVDNGVTVLDPALAFRGDDRNAGVNPAVTGTAYTNSDNNPATGTELFAIDAARDVLVAFPPPGGANSGQMATVGSLGVDTRLAIGFDIVGSANGTAYAVLSTSPSGKSALYTIDLTTGRASQVGLLAQTRSYLVGMALEP